MNYFEHHIGDYAAATAHLTLVEDAIYSRLLRRYYLQEEALPTDVKQVARLAGARSPEEMEAVQAVLGEFFTLGDDGWHNKRADEEIERYQAKQDKARASAAARWNRDAIPSDSERNADAMRTHSEGNALQTPDTSNQAEKQKQKRVQPPAAPSRFEEFWVAYPNKKGKQEAEKTWRRRKLDDRCDELIAHVHLMQAEDDGWIRGYVPMGSTYLNQARWQDVPREPARAGPAPTQSSPPSKTLTAIQTLQGMKSHANLDPRRDSGRAEQAALLGPGSDAGIGPDRRHGRHVG
ncbi:TPA: YdaU family protein [Stenotrophomonas maltophilia]